MRCMRIPQRGLCGVFTLAATQLVNRMSRINNLLTAIEMEFISYNPLIGIGDVIEAPIV
jgi:hypothetical protein